MSLRNRLNRLESQIANIKAKQGSTVEVPIGVWHSDRETGEIIPNSGPMARVSKERVGSYGVLLVPEPCKSKEDFIAMVE